MTAARASVAIEHVGDDGQRRVRHVGRVVGAAFRVHPVGRDVDALGEPLLGAIAEERAKGAAVQPREGRRDLPAVVRRVHPTRDQGGLDGIGDRIQLCRRASARPSASAAAAPSGCRWSASHTSLTVNEESGGESTLSPPTKRPLAPCSARSARTFSRAAATRAPSPAYVRVRPEIGRDQQLRALHEPAVLVARVRAASERPLAPRRRRPPEGDARSRIRPAPSVLEAGVDVGVHDCTLEDHEEDDHRNQRDDRGRQQHRPVDVVGADDASAARPAGCTGRGRSARSAARCSRSSATGRRRSPATTAMGRASGSMIRKKVRSSHTPSMRAASSRSLGTVMKNWRNMKMPVAVMIDGTMMPARVL